MGDKDSYELFKAGSQIVLTKKEQKKGKRKTCNKINQEMSLTLAESMAEGTSLRVLREKTNSDTGEVHIRNSVRKVTSIVINLTKNDSLQGENFLLETANSFYEVKKIN